MKTEIKKQGNTILVTMNGKLDFETQIPLREDLARLAKQARTESAPKKIIFNLENLQFVGSSGISSFIQTMKEFNQNAPSKPRYCHVRTEFKKIIQALDVEKVFDFYDDEDSAIEN